MEWQKLMMDGNSSTPCHYLKWYHCPAHVTCVFVDWAGPKHVPAQGDGLAQALLHVPAHFFDDDFSFKG